MKVLIFPEDKNNPYQELLYSEIRRLHPKDTFTYISAKYILAPFYPFIFLIRRIQGYKIIHFHWLPFIIRLPIPFAEQLAYAYSLICLYTLRILRYKIVWTLHDVLPFDKHTSDDRKIMQYYLDSSAAVTLLSSANNTDAKKAGLKLDSSKTTVIPHGNYAKSNPNDIGRSDARKKLHIPQDCFVYVFFGIIRPYKNIPGLLEAFTAVRKEIPSARLIIAGRVFDPSIEKVLSDAKKLHKEHLILRLENIPDDEVQIYYNAADAAVYPFNEITNSGSVIMAATFGKPIIAPRVGALIDVPKEAGIFYDTNNHKSLLDSMLKIANSDKATLKNLSSASQDYANLHSWEHIGEKTYSVYEQIIKKSAK